MDMGRRLSSSSNRAFLSPRSPGVWTVTSILLVLLLLGAASTAVMATNYTLTLTAVPSTGGTVSGGGSIAGGSTLNITATPNAGYCFVGWSNTNLETGIDYVRGTIGAGNGAHRRKCTSGTMPAATTTLYAIFAVANFYDGFEGYNGGEISMNYTSSGQYNATGNGDLLNDPSGWLSYYGPDGGIGTSYKFYGSRAESAWGASNDLCAVNLAYRYNGGAYLTGNFNADWYLYDQYGPTGTGVNYGDWMGLALYPTSTLPLTGKDYAPSDYNNASAINNWTTAVELGCAGTGSPTCYQYRTCTNTNGAWTNTTKARTQGWHRARIHVGPQKTDGTNVITFFVDDMTTPLATVNGASTIGWNGLQMMNSAAGGSAGWLDNVRVGPVGSSTIDRFARLGHFAYADTATRMSHDELADLGSLTETTVMQCVPGTTYGGKTWTLINGNGDAAIDLNASYAPPSETDNGVTYLFTYIVNNGAAITNAVLRTGSDDGVKVWMNGTAIEICRCGTRFCAGSGHNNRRKYPQRLQQVAGQGNAGHRRLCGSGPFVGAWTRRSYLLCHGSHAACQLHFGDQFRSPIGR